MSLILFHGDKGGTGKSTSCKAFIDWAHVSGFPVLPVDADTRNPDVARMFAGVLPSHQINLRTEDGWAQMVDLMAEHVQTTNIAVNLPAGIGDEDEKNGHIFMEAAHEIGIPVVLFWVINREFDSVNQLRHQLEHGMARVGPTRMICLRNQHFAPNGEKFDLWDDSNTRKMFESRGGQTADFPALSSRVVTALTRVNVPYTNVTDLCSWDRLVLKKWLTKVGELFTSLNLPLLSSSPA